MMPLWSGKQIMPLTDVWQGFKIAQMSDLGDVGRLVNIQDIKLQSARS